MKNLSPYLSTVLLGLMMYPGLLFATPINGLTVALSPDGQTLIASGSNRAFLRLNPDTLEVVERVWHGYSIIGMAFNKDGTRLAVTDAGMGGVITVFDVATWTRQFDVRGREVVAFCSTADLFAGIEGQRSAAPFLNVHRISDGETLMRVPLLPRRLVVATALDLDGKMAAVLYGGENDPNEEKAAPEPALQGLDRIVAMQQGDGRTSIVEFYDIASGDRIAHHTLFYSLNRSARAAMLDGNLVVVSANNQNAVIGQDGTVKIFQSENSVNYGMGFTADHRTIMTGGLAHMAITCAAENSSKGFPVLTRLPSWPEYFRGFAGNPEGPLYGATDGYRVFAIHRNGSVLQEAAAY